METITKEDFKKIKPLLIELDETKDFFVEVEELEDCILLEISNDDLEEYYNWYFSEETSFDIEDFETEIKDRIKKQRKLLTI